MFKIVVEELWICSPTESYIFLLLKSTIPQEQTDLFNMMIVLRIISNEIWTPFNIKIARNSTVFFLLLRLWSILSWSLVDTCDSYLWRFYCTKNGNQCLFHFIWGEERKLGDKLLLNRMFDFSQKKKKTQ